MNQSPAYLYQLVPPLRSVKYNLCGANAYESNVERTNRFASTSFQNCIKEWNQLDVSVRSSQTSLYCRKWYRRLPFFSMPMKAMLNEPIDLLVPLFKTALRTSEWIQLVRAMRRSYFGAHDTEGIIYLSHLRVNTLATFE